MTKGSTAGDLLPSCKPLPWLQIVAGGRSDDDGAMKFLFGVLPFAGLRRGGCGFGSLVS